MADKPQNRWNESFVLGIPALDAQHKGLFDIANELDSAVYEGKEQTIVGQIIERLKEYCQYHFGTEERLMSENGYPGLHAHMLQHDHFTSTVAEFDAQNGAAAKKVPLRISSFLKEWMAEHIAIEDRKFVPFILRQPPAKQAESKKMPLLVEVESAGQHPDTAMCARLAKLLMQKGIPSVSMASTLDQTRTVLEEMASDKLAPVIFVVNTFGAKDILGHLDLLMGDLPVLYLRRALFSGQSGLLDQLNVNKNSQTMASVLGRMKPRLVSMWYYGAKNIGRTAERAAEALCAFLNSGDFWMIEHAKTENCTPRGNEGP
ncbi:MAG: bacteriohemerythrin [Planctomycetota bacterium]